MKRLLSTLVVFVGLFVFSMTSASAQHASIPPFSGGNGTEATPYLLSTADDIIALSKLVEESQNDCTGLFFKMTQDIDMTGKTMKPIGNNHNSSYTPHYFCGTFDGGDYTINNLVIEAKTKRAVGLFGMVKNATIKNLTIENSTLKGQGITGGLCAVMANSVISNCHIGKKVYVESISDPNTGGVIGAILVGDKNVIEDCTHAGHVRGAHSTTGGILGLDNAKGSVVRRCFNIGVVEDWMGIVGGIVGETKYGHLSIEDCGNTGTVHAGKNGASYHAAGMLANIDGTAVAKRPVIKNCYNAGEVASNVDDAPPHPMTCAMQSTTTENCYYDPVSSKTAVDDVTSVSAEEMAKPAFVDQLNQNRPNGPWRIIENVNKGLPVPTKMKPSSEEPTPISSEFKPLFDRVTIPVSQDYAMFIKEYSAEAYNHIKANRIVIKLESLTPDVIQSSGDKYRAIKPGEGTVKVRIAGAVKGSLDQFDENNVFGETTFTVEAVPFEEYRTTFPAVPTIWRHGAEEVKEFAQNTCKLTLFTEQYNKLIRVPESMKPHNDIFLTGLSDFPLINTRYTEDTGAFIQATVFTSTFLFIDNTAPLRKILEKAGYEYRGYSSVTGTETYRHEESKTSVFLQFVALQGVRYGGISFMYDEKGEYVPDSNEAIEAFKGEILLADHGSSFDVTVPEGCLGENVQIFDLAGKLIASQVANDTTLHFDAVQEKTFIVRVKGCLALKVIL